MQVPIGIYIRRDHACLEVSLKNQKHDLNVFTGKCAPTKLCQVADAICRRGHLGADLWQSPESLPSSVILS